MQISTIPIAARFLRPEFLGLLVSGLVFGCAPELEPTPSAILGHWSTEATRYRDRSLEIRPDAILFGTGPYSAPRLHILIGVESQPSSDPWNVCRLSYREDDGTVGQLEISYRDQPRPQIRFANRQEIWIRGCLHFKHAS